MGPPWRCMLHAVYGGGRGDPDCRSCKEGADWGQVGKALMLFALHLLGEAFLVTESAVTDLRPAPSKCAPVTGPRFLCSPL